MSEMVERVARAICGPNADRRVCWPGPQDKAKLWESYVEQARAAIEAMREPTDNMPFPESVKQYWRAMIDEALR